MDCKSVRGLGINYAQATSTFRTTTHMAGLRDIGFVPFEARCEQVSPIGGNATVHLVRDGAWYTPSWQRPGITFPPLPSCASAKQDWRSQSTNTIAMQDQDVLANL